jgi:tRNA threonylcarbamoyladenosine biosynthesis protein TsaB
MYILHIETSTSICSVALSHGKDLIAFEDMTDGMNHTALLVPAIERLLLSAGIGTKALSAIAVSSGPGSYTGLRVGSGTAKAMAYALNVPLIGVSSLLALARAAFDQYPEAKWALPMIDARRKEVYTILYHRSLEEKWPIRSAILNEAFFKEEIQAEGKIIACGDGALKIGLLSALCPGLQIDSKILGSARHMVGPAWDAYSNGETQDPLHFVPYYLKPPNITQSKKPGHVGL